MGFQVRQLQSRDKTCRTLDWSRWSFSAKPTCPIRSSPSPTCNGVKSWPTTWACRLAERNRASTPRDAARMMENSFPAGSTRLASRFLCRRTIRLTRRPKLNAWTLCARWRTETTTAKTRRNQDPPSSWRSSPLTWICRWFTATRSNKTDRSAHSRAEECWSTTAVETNGRHKIPTRRQRAMCKRHRKLATLVAMLASIRIRD